MLHDVLSKRKFLYGGILGTCKNKPLDIEIQPYSKL